MKRLSQTHVRCNAVFLKQRFLIERPSDPVTDRSMHRCQTLVKWNCSGSSVLKLTFKPTLKKSGRGFRSYVKNNALLLRGLIARPICLR